MSTKIEWTDETWNPVTGCTEVSPGCDHCYAKTFAERWRGTPGHHFERGFDLTLRPERLDQPLRWKKPRRVFVNSMSDLFHDNITDEFIARVWVIMGAAPRHTYQILTKRHARMRSWVSRWYAGDIAEPYEVRPTPDFPGYFVTTHGEILGKRSDTRGGLAQELGGQGHCRVTLHREGSPRSGERQLVHRLVLTTFVRPARDGEQACHRNGDPSDNRLSNLYWGTQQDNWHDRKQHGNGRSWSKLSVEDVAVIRTRCAASKSAYRVAQDYPVSDTQIRNILRGDQWATSQPAAMARKPARAVLDSVWLGVSVEDQKWADIRIPALLDTPAAVRFLSCEPLLGPLDVTEWLHESVCPIKTEGVCICDPAECEVRVDWVICGGESGPGARPMDLAWPQSIVGKCAAAGVPVHVKQLGSVWAQANGADPKGGDWDFWPSHLRLREFPEVDR
jgi:protein gp37